MADETGSLETRSQTPDGAALGLEMKDIMTNPANPLHAGYHRNDPAVMKQIEAKYTKVYGDKKVELDGGGNLPKGSESPDEAARENASARGEFAEANRAELSEQWKSWGAEAEGNMALIKSFAQEYFGDPANAHTLENMMSAFLAEGGNPAKANAILLKMAKDAQRTKANG